MRRLHSVPGFWSDVALALVALALVLRVAIPAGMMVGRAPSAFSLVVCTGHGPMVVGPDASPKAPARRPSQAACDFAAAATPGTPPPLTIVSQPLAVAARRTAGPFAADLAPGRGLAAPPPPSHAPPEFADLI
jgi:hypothetical protein